MIPMELVRARPQIKDACKQTDVTSKRYAKALVLKLRKRANMTPKVLVWACPQIKEASKQIDVTSRWPAKTLILKFGK